MKARYFSVCFKIFDGDRDGKLNQTELKFMLETMIEIAEQTKPGHCKQTIDKVTSEPLANSLNRNDSRASSVGSKSYGYEGRASPALEKSNLTELGFPAHRVVILWFPFLTPGSQREAWGPRAPSLLT